jgi:hypothetical protein
MHKREQILSTNRHPIVMSLVRVLGLDSHILSTLSLRIWSILAGGATTLLVPSFLSPTHQGYYYTFNSVVATQIFFELGLNHVLIQLTSHAAAHLKRLPSQRVEDNINWHRAILSLINLSTKWNAVMATLFFIIIMICGGLFFSNTGTLPTYEWLYVWIILITATSANLAMSAHLAICEGLGEVGQVARLRLLQSIIGYSLLWTLLISGAGLWAAVAIPLSCAVCTAGWLRLRQLGMQFEKTLCTKDSSVKGYTYRQDIFPLQWRIAISWASGYIIFSLLVPVVFAKQGAVEAGRLGLCLTILSSITAVGMSWISAKVPAFSRHIALNERTELNILFQHQAIRAVSMTALGVIFFIITAEFAGHFEPLILYRLPSLVVMVLLAVVTISNIIIFSMAAYMRAHKEEPLLASSVTLAFLIAIAIFFTSNYGLTATVSAYTVVNVFVGLPWSILIFNRYRTLEQ